MSDVPTADQIAAMTPTQFKTYENLLRRMASRQLLRLHKTRRRDRQAHDYGTYTLVDRDGKTVVNGTIIKVHRYLVRQ